MNYMKSFLEMQNKFMEGWKNQMEEGSSDAHKTFYDMQKLYLDSMKKSGDYYSKGLEAFDFKPYSFNNIQDVFNKYKGFYTSYDFSKMMDPEMSEVMTKMFNANKLYLQIYNFWNKLNTDFINALDVDSDKFKDFVEKNANMTYEMLTGALPDEVNFIFDGIKDITKKYFDATSNFYGPWANEIDKLKDLLFEGTLEGDPKKISDFFYLWREKYDQTFGKAFNSPALGISRNLIEQQNKILDTFINVFIKFTEFTTNLSVVQNTAFKNIINEYMELTKEGLEIKTFEEFYRFWSKRMDSYLVEHFGSEEFSKLLAQFSEAFMDFRIEYNRLIEYYFADSPIVTEGKIDSMIRNIYELKKEVRKLNKEIEDLKAEKTEKDKK